MPGSTVRVTNLGELPPSAGGIEEAPADDKLYGRRNTAWQEIIEADAELLQHLERFVELHTSDENTRALISKCFAKGRPDLALMVLLIAVSAGAP